MDERNIIDMLQFAILKFMYWGFITYVINLRFLRTSHIGIFVSIRRIYSEIVLSALKWRIFTILGPFCIEKAMIYYYKVI